MTLHAGVRSIMANGSEKQKYLDHITDNDHDGDWVFLQEHLISDP